MTRATIFRTINMGRNALRAGKTERAQALLAKAADALGMGWMMWSMPHAVRALLGASVDLLAAADKVSA